jgi:galactose-1-phosphate uridylyltransferase
MNFSFAVLNEGRRPVIFVSVRRSKNMTAVCSLSSPPPPSTLYLKNICPEVNTSTNHRETNKNFNKTTPVGHKLVIPETETHHMELCVTTAYFYSPRVFVTVKASSEWIRYLERQLRDQCRLESPFFCSLHVVCPFWRNYFQRASGTKSAHVTSHIKF